MSVTLEKNEYLYRIIDQLKDENDELRKLVKDYAAYKPGDCQHCGYGEQCKTHQTNCHKVRINLVVRTRKFGIEVS